MEKSNHEQQLRSHRGSCDACMFCGIKSDAARPGIIFVCRHSPPAVNATVVMTANGPAWQVACVWPEVTKDDWCGEFQPQSN